MTAAGVTLDGREAGVGCPSFDFPLGVGKVWLNGWCNSNMQVAVGHLVLATYSTPSIIIPL